MKNAAPYIIKTITALHRLFALVKPDHPLISVIDFELLSYRHSDVWRHFTNEFYCITIKHSTNAVLKYGQKDYDFEEGIMTFTKPGQVFAVTVVQDNPVKGYMLVFKPELLYGYPLAQSIRQYGFFEYRVAEALHLADKEEKVITGLLQQMQLELRSNIDNFSQDVIVSHIDLLLNYANRFYNRQFITRKGAGNDLLSRMEAWLTNYFQSEHLQASGLPSVTYLAEQMNLSPGYLSDMLRHLTGKNAQQYIQSFFIDHAKGLLSTTNLTVSEIAYHFGFQYPQSFNKLFKSKTNMTPLQFRTSFGI